MNKHELIMSVRELLERHCSITEIAARLHENIDVIKAIIDALV
jgi:hypothetical protein